MVSSLTLGDLVMCSRDIAAQRITPYLSGLGLITSWRERRVPRSPMGKLVIYLSPVDWALIVKMLVRSRYRRGQVTAADISQEARRFLSPRKIPGGFRTFPG